MPKRIRLVSIIVWSLIAGTVWSPLSVFALGGPLAGGAAVPQNVQQLAMDPGQPEIVYAAANEGIYRSTDGGRNWVLIFSGSGAPAEPLVAADPSLPSTILAGGWFQQLRSTDSGLNWNSHRPGPLYYPTAICYDLQYPANAWTAWQYAGHIGSAPAGFIKRSADGGATWQDAIWNRSDLPTCLEVDPANPQILYAGCRFEMGLFKSTDTASTWFPANRGLPAQGRVLAVRVHPRNGQMVYCATSQGVYRSQDGGESWLPAGSFPLLWEARDLLIAPWNPSILFAATENDGILMSPDGGQNWSSFNEGLSNLHVNCLAASLRQPGVILAGTEDGVCILSAGSAYEAYIPMLARTGGPDGKYWQTGLSLLNGSDEEVAATLELLIANRANPAPPSTTVTIPAGQLLDIPDILGSHFPQVTNGALRIRCGSRRLAAAARFFHALRGQSGTMSTLIPARQAYEALNGPGETAYFHGLLQSDVPNRGSRTNIGLTSASPFPVKTRITLFGEWGQQLGVFNRQLQPFEHCQFNQIFRLCPGTGAVNSGYASLEVLTPNGQVHAYAMVIDNFSSDTRYLPPNRFREYAWQTEPAIIPACAHNQSTSGITWCSDLELLNTRSVPATISISPLWQGRTNQPDKAASRITIPARRSIRLDDVLAVPGNAALYLEGLGKTIFAQSCFSQRYQESGQEGMLVPAEIPGSQLLGDATRLGLLFPLRSGAATDGNYRSHLGLVNSENFPVQVRLDFFNQAGQRAGQLAVTLKPFEYRQLIQIHSLLDLESLPLGYATLEVITGAARIYAFGMVIDNRSGDPVYVPLQVIVP